MRAPTPEYLKNNTVIDRKRHVWSLLQPKGEGKRHYIYIYIYVKFITKSLCYRPFQINYYLITDNGTALMYNWTDMQPDFQSPWHSEHNMNILFVFLRCCQETRSFKIITFPSKISWKYWRAVPIKREAGWENGQSCSWSSTKAFVSTDLILFKGIRFGTDPLL